MLAIVLALPHEIDGPESFGEIVPRGLPLGAAAIGITAPVEIDAGEIAAIIPAAFVDQGAEAGAIRPRLRSEYAMSRLPLRRLEAHATRFERAPLGPDIGGDRIGLIGLVEFGNGADRAADNVHLGRKCVAKQAGDAERDVHARPLQFA